jgi:hypothetical protein
MAPISAILCIMYALVSLAQINRASSSVRIGFGEDPWAPATYEPSPLLALLMIAVYLVGAIFSFFFWFGMSELVLLCLDVERNTRRAALRLSKGRTETPSRPTNRSEA